MRVIDPTAKTAPTLASTARRTQIVAATIEVIAADGFAQASFARIAERAGLSSTRLISYHFAGKDALISAVVEDVLAAMAGYVGSRIDEAENAEATAEKPGEGHATAILRAYIEGSVGFIDTHRPHMQALMQIVLSFGGLPGAPGAPGAPGGQDTPGGPVVGAGEAETPLEGLLRHGRRTGEFRAFDVPTVASAIQRSIEGLPFLLSAQPDLDCEVYGSELVELYLRGVRSDAP